MRSSLPLGNTFFITVDNKELCELQSLALMIGREIFAVFPLFFVLSLSHNTHNFSLREHYVGFVSVWGDRVEKIKSQLCLLFFAVLILIRAGTTPMLNREL